MSGTRLFIEATYRGVRPVALEDWITSAEDGDLILVIKTRAVTMLHNRRANELYALEVRDDDDEESGA